MSPKEGMPIEGNPPKPYQLWRLYASGQKCDLLAEADTKEGLKYKRRFDHKTAIYHNGERLEPRRPAKLK
jgi:hypothetical protein